MSNVIRRFIGLVLVLLGVTGLVFIVLRVVPGDPVAVLLNEHVSAEAISRIKQSLDLDKPAYIQFLNYIKNALRGDLGQSYYMKQSVSSLIITAFPYTLKLTVLSAAFAWIFGIAAGIVCAMYPDKVPDHLFCGVSLFGISIPVFVIALILQYVLYFKLSLLPLMYDGSATSLIMPAVALGAGSAGSIARLTRSGLIQQRDERYLDTARAKGLTTKAALFKHGLKNAMLPVITMMAIQLSGMLSGAVITETVFGIAGIGKLAVTAVNTRDMPLLMGTVLFTAFVISLGNIIADILNTCLDPRLRIKT